MWFATTNGLIRYDGHEMRVFQENPLDATSVGDNYTRELAEDHNGDLWVGTGHGELYRYNRRQGNFTHIEKDPGADFSNEVRDLLLDSAGRVWVANNFGLELVDKEELSRKQYFAAGHPIHHYLLESLLEDHQGNIWIGTGGRGLHILDPNTGKSQKMDDNLVPGAGSMRDIILDMFLADDGKIWMAHDNELLSCIDPIKKVFSSVTITRPDQSPVRGIWKIEEAADGALWLGTRDQGLIHFVPSSGKLTFYEDDPLRFGSLSQDIVGSILKTKEALWIGHFGRGVDQVYLGEFGLEQIPLQTGVDKEAYIRRVVEDHNGQIWAATHGFGLYRFDPGSGLTTHYTNDPGNRNGLAHDLVWDLLVDPEGLLWIATHAGLQAYDGETDRFVSYPIEKDDGDLPVRSLLQDGEKNLWIGTFSGVYRMVRGTERPEFFELPQTNPAFIVLDLFQDSKEYIWASVFGVGVYRIDPNTAEVDYFNNDPKDLQSLSGNIVLHFAEDGQGNLWLGTQGGGLGLFVPETATDSSHFQHWRPYNSELPNENVWDIYTDKGPNLWLKTDAGLVTFNTQNQKVTSYQFPGISKGFRMDTQADKPERVFLRAGDRIYRFSPDSISQNGEIPPVRITTLEINGKDVLPKGHFEANATNFPILDQSILFTESLDLRYWQNDLTFEFSALNFIQPEKNQYKFKLEGYDSEWTETDAWNRRIRYTNLSPGNYQFRVIASNNDGIWNETGSTLALRIAFPWWHTWWAYFAYALLLFLTIRSIYNFQLNRRLIENEALRLKELDIAKNRLFTNVTHEFRTPLTVILGMAHKIKEAPQEWLSEGLDAIQRNGRQLLQLVNQMLDLSRLEANSLQLAYQQGNVVAYLAYLVQSYQSFAASREIDLLWESSEKEVTMDYAPDALAKILGNLLANAIRYTPAAGKIIVRLNLENAEQLKKVRLTVQDTGIGVPEDQSARIFDRFYHIEQPLSDEGEISGSHYPSDGGTGIGLALVRELVELMEGHISVESKLQVGTTFRIDLPVRNTAPSSGHWDPVAPTFTILEARNSATTTKVEDTQLPIALIIEDNADVTRYLESCLVNRYEVHTAVDGKQGVERAIGLVPDIVICDVMMPELDGYQVCYTLKNDQRTSHIPIVMLTAKVDRHSRLHGLRQGADAYLAKPFDPEELSLKLNNLLELRQKIQAHLMDFPQNDGGQTPLFPKEDAFLQELQSTVLSKISDETFGIPEICEALAISRSQLHRKLKAITGKSASLVIRSIRLNEARNRLLETEQTIMEIAYQVGFSNPSYFSTVFSETFGMSPSEMREKRPMRQ